MQTKQVSESITFSKTKDLALRRSNFDWGGGGGRRGNMSVQTNTSIELLIKFIALQWKK